VRVLLYKKMLESRDLTLLSEPLLIVGMRRKPEMRIRGGKNLVPSLCPPPVAVKGDEGVKEKGEKDASVFSFQASFSILFIHQPPPPCTGAEGFSTFPFLVYTKIFCVY